MSFWTAIVIIVAIAAFTEVLRTRHRTRAGIVADEDGNEKFIERHDAGLKREVEELRERVKVLERIVTDDRDSKRLAAEIESLRENKEKV